MRFPNRRTSGILASLFGLATFAVVALGARSASMSPVTTSATAVPAPEVEVAPANGSVASSAPIRVPTSETIVLAGGCFWGVQGVYQHVKGVTMAESGYTGGTRDTADYETVSSGRTGHAESVRVTFDPTRVTYGQILQIFFSVVHDPTELNRQGPDTGTQYRSEIFAQTNDQQRMASAYMAQLTRKGVYAHPIVTSIEMNTNFYAAERYHQDFVNLNPTYSYVAIHDIPKVHELQRLFPQLYRDHPVLVFAADHQP